MSTMGSQPPLTKLCVETSVEEEYNQEKVGSSLINDILFNKKSRWIKKLGKDMSKFLTQHILESTNLAYKITHPPIALRGHGNNVCACEFSPDGSKLLTSSYDGSATLWDLEGNCITSFEGYTRDEGHYDEYVDHTATFSPDGTRVLTIATHCTLTLWNLNGTYIKTLKANVGEDFYPWKGEFSPDGKSILVFDDGGGSILIDIESNKVIFDIGIVLFNDDERILDFTNMTQVTILNFKGETIKTIQRGDIEKDELKEGVLSPDGKRMVLLGYYAESAADYLEFWDVAEGNLIKNYKSSPSLDSIELNPDGKTVLTSSGDGTVKLWNLDGTCLQTFNSNNNRRGFGHALAKFSPDGKMVLTTPSNNTAKLWNLDGQCLQTFKFRTSNKRPSFDLLVEFSPDGKTVLTNSSHNTVKLWNLDGTCLKTIKISNNYTQSPDNSKIVSYGKNHTTYISTIKNNFLSNEILLPQVVLLLIIDRIKEERLCNPGSLHFAFDFNEFPHLQKHYDQIPAYIKQQYAHYVIEQTVNLDFRILQNTSLHTPSQEDILLYSVALSILTPLVKTIN